MDTDTGVGTWSLDRPQVPTPPVPSPVSFRELEGRRGESPGGRRGGQRTRVKGVTRNGGGGSRREEIGSGVLLNNCLEYDVSPVSIPTR